MKGKVGIDKGYFIKQYETLRVVGEVDDIPQELLTNKLFTNSLYYFLLVAAESVALRYDLLTAQVKSIPDPQKKVEFLEEEKKKVLDIIEQTFHVKLLEEQANNQTGE